VLYIKNMVFDKKKYYREYYKKNREKYLGYIKKYQNSEKGKKKIIEYMKEYNQRPEVKERNNKRLREYYKNSDYRKNYFKDWNRKNYKGERRKKLLISQRKRYENRTPEEKEKYLEIQRDRSKNNKEYNAKRIKKWRKNNPKKVRAHKLSVNIKLKESCEFCGSMDNLNKHHPDYSKPLLVVTLCKICHSKEHRIQI